MMLGVNRVSYVLGMMMIYWVKLVVASCLSGLLSMAISCENSGRINFSKYVVMPFFSHLCLSVVFVLC